MFQCSGFCERLKPLFIQRPEGYHNGQKRCSVCKFFLITENTRCECCNVILRTKRHASKGNRGREKCLA